MSASSGPPSPVRICERRGVRPPPSEVLASGGLAMRLLYRGLVGVVLMGAVLLLYSGVAKLLAPSEFVESLRVHDVLHGAALDAARWGIPVGETLLGMFGLVASATGRRVASAALLIAILFAFFAAYSGWLVVRPPPKPVGCGCGLGLGIVRDWRPLLGRNSAMAAVMAGVALALGWLHARAVTAR